MAISPVSRLVRQIGPLFRFATVVAFGQYAIGLALTMWLLWKAKGATGPAAVPWLVFCSPPYDFFVDRTDQVLELLGTLLSGAPAESLFVVESDGRFDCGLLVDPESWDVRRYPPAVVAIYVKPR